MLPNARIVKAVKGIDLDIYEGEVFCLLGHNGAGKTTTISMLTGLLGATEGNAFINGNSINENMDTIRKSLGICPQHDVLFSRLTTREHLYLYARLKGVDNSNVENEIKTLNERLNDITNQIKTLNKSLNKRHTTYTTTKWKIKKTKLFIFIT